MTIHLHDNDLPDDFKPAASVAIDTETLGLRHGRDRLCLVQVSNGDGDAHLVRVAREPAPAPKLQSVLADPDIIKIFHFARFDLAALFGAYGVMAVPVYCTKIASLFARTYGIRHSLGELTLEMLDVKLTKQEQCTDWGRAELSDAQLNYAANDVLYLHQLMDGLNAMLAREGRAELAQSCFDFLPARVRIDLAGWGRTDVFTHDADQNA